MTQSIIPWKRDIMEAQRYGYRCGVRSKDRGLLRRLSVGWGIFSSPGMVAPSRLACKPAMKKVYSLFRQNITVRKSVSERLVDVIPQKWFIFVAVDGWIILLIRQNVASHGFRSKYCRYTQCVLHMYYTCNML